jgi:hypothetical protein
VAQKEQEIGTLKQAKKEGDITNAELRKLHIKDLSEISRIKLQIDTLLTINHSGTVVVIHDTITHAPKNAILLPFSFEKKDKWIDLKGDFNSQGKLDCSLKLQIDGDLLIGVDKITKKNTATFINDCPYLDVLSINSIKMDVAKPKKYGIGIIGGYGMNLIGTIKTYPFLGIGLSYIIIRF